MTLTDILHDAGLTPRQAVVYLSTLEMGSAPASSIARHAGMNRVTVYDILKELTKGGIATSVTKSRTTYYSVVSPEMLLTQAEQKVERLKGSLPELLALAHKFDNKPKVEYFEGREGLIKIYEDQISFGGEKGIRAFLGAQETDPKLLDYLYTVNIPQRVKAGVFAKVITSDSPENRKYAGIDKQSLKETRLISNPLLTLSNEITMYGGHKVSVCMYGKNELSGVIIHSISLHDTMCGLFDYIRETSNQQQKQLLQN